MTESRTIIVINNALPGDTCARQWIFTDEAGNVTDLGVGVATSMPVPPKPPTGIITLTLPNGATITAPTLPGAVPDICGAFTPEDRRAAIAAAVSAVYNETYYDETNGVSVLDYDLPAGWSMCDSIETP